MSRKWLKPWVEVRCREMQRPRPSRSHRESPRLNRIKHNGGRRPGHDLATGPGAQPMAVEEQGKEASQ